MMKNLTTSVPLFPLPVFLLPGGITRLRIFEARYLKMVTIASKAQGFVICANTQEGTEAKPQWGSWVDIINFDQGDDGVLEIDVQCKSLVNITTINKDADNLHFAEITEIAHWSENIAELDSNELSQSLAQVFATNARLSEIYTEKPIHNSHWVVARWLELLPVNLTVKSSFVSEHNYQAAKHFVQAILFHES